jgi:voltage-gated potassium channel
MPFTSQSPLKPGDDFRPGQRRTAELAPFLRRLRWVGLAVATLLAGGTIAYTLSEDVGVWDGFLWALDTIATEGARNRPQTIAGEITWVVLIVLGVGTLLYALVTVVEVFVSGHLRTLLDDHREQRAIDALTGHVIICGFGRVGRQVARDLAAAGERYVVIDQNDEHREHAHGVGVRFIEGSASEDDVLDHAGIERARAIIACVDSDAENVFITLSARQLNGDIPIIARASHFDTEPKLRRAGATRVISPYRASGSEMARLALTPQVGGVVDVAPSYRLEEIEVEPGSAAQDAAISDVRGDAIIVGVRRADGSFIPQPSAATRLHIGDALIALGAAHTLTRLEGALGPQRSSGRG